MRSLLVDLEGKRYDGVDAVLAAQRHNPAGVVQGVKDLAIWVGRADWASILPAYARCVRITRDQPERYTVNPAALVEPAEKDLLCCVEKAEVAPRRSGSVEDFLQAFLPMIPAVNRFFDSVLVMAEDPALRSSRLGMLQRIAALAQGCADLSYLEGF
jgi:glycyl-tRNA synthetase